MMVSTKQRAQSIQIASTSANEESNTSSPEMDESALKQDALELQPAEADKQKEHSKNADFSVVYDYWKNFDIKKLQDDLNNQIEIINNNVQDLDKINSCFSDMNAKLTLLDEDAVKTVSPIVNLLQTEIDSLSNRTKANKITCTHLFKLLANVPDPFPVIEQVKSSKVNKHTSKLQLENKTLKDKILLLEKELIRVRHAEADSKEKELIVSLSEQITNTMAMNIDLTSKLKINEGELESYKKILSDYKAQLSEMKCKQINEIKSEILKENDKLKLNQTSELNSSLMSKRSRSPSLNNGQASSNLKTLLDMSKEAGKSSGSSCSSSSSSISSACSYKPEAKQAKPEADNGHDYDSSTETDNDENALNSPPNLSPSSSAYEPLNTADVAQKVRDLLATHNIGQRVFAKCVLGLSQGTVSELLSKPKHWDKLTEKGRESYRKMYTWSMSAASVHSLKAISPKKAGKDTYALGAAKDDAATLERIAQILYDAQKKMHGPTENFSSPMSPSSSNSESSPLMSPVCSRKDDSDENETALDLTIKNAKKRKLNSNETSSDDEDTSSNTNEYESAKAASLLNTGLNNQLGLAALNQLQPLLSSQFGKKFTSLLNQGPGNTILMQQQQQQMHQLQQLQQQMMPSQAFSRATSTPSPSPSLNTSTQSTLSASKPLKCVLPPVSQDQFDKYSQINTDELVKKVKDLLSKFSISQRLFGECILGLSQGSVSDLLARPKPWVMLTQKGREPFIRMQMFIDDPDSIKRLMANQYKTPAANADKRSVDSNNNLVCSLSPSVRNPNASVFGAKSVNDSCSNDSEAKTALVPAQINIIPYDISALSGVAELNTDEITNRVKETLMNNNIGQKLFGEAVLNLSQGTVSELLSKPKPWNTLSIKGREPYLRMYMWLSDPAKLPKLSEWKEEKNLQKKNCAHTDTEPHDHQKPKRRFIFSEEQKEQLMKAFKYDPYPAVNQMEQLAGRLALQTRTVINWFHNHRMRIRYKNTQASGGAQAASLSDISSLSNTLHSRARSFNAGLADIKFHGVLEQLNKMTDKTNFLSLLANVNSGAHGRGNEPAEDDEDGDDEQDGYEDDDDDDDHNHDQSYQEYNEENNDADVQYNEFGDEHHYDFEQQNGQECEQNLDEDEDDEQSVNLPSGDLNRNKRRKPHNPQKLYNASENLMNKTCDVDRTATS